ncbi:hypothetical protein M2451_004099 [Dysgonomonas sp. PFB1-18]|uniref:TraQ conjugal transfer family protein n=1 Tax=unclassified Dysgonomonas TaxID=2630389 RepID=UPI002475FE84|nr:MULTISPECIES: TraQ conjugal transfer family protein [unclassified Dysgonomonas]MDH6311163.1 hypothetical protein [Dysgonomonas sp. PF1-14]MDH6341053.1 hypothetical protein [Dysgonomonas sp. PF1-16]MDH6382750.1 hypothetical protein [Dysgonomonas sp. PFB1-18]MDH6400035.1 hypothetical protein [Dysgonomonas sp. PF1-23]
MKKCASYIIFTLLLAAIACACSDNIDIRQSYEFEVTYLPVPKKLKVGETIEIRCQLERSGYYTNTAYRFRYFQSDGEGELRMGGSEPFLPNDYYDLTKESFSFYYTSRSDEQQTIDIYFFDDSGNSCVLSFQFNSDNKEEEK